MKLRLGCGRGGLNCEGAGDTDHSDIDADGDVDLADLAELLGDYGETCE